MISAYIETDEKILIDDLEVSAYYVPSESPESDGTLEWNSTTLILVSIKAGNETGIGYTYADVSVAFYIHHTLKNIIAGKNVMNIPALTSKLNREIRNNGETGIGMMAVSAIDNALWDLKAKLLNVPLAHLLGKVKNEILIYGSGGFTSQTDAELQQQLGEWAESDIRYVKMKIGRDAEKDVQRVKLAHEAIGSNAELFVDANGAYEVKQAIALSNQFAKYDVTWFEEPVSSDNLEGLKFIREQVPGQINIAAGEYGYSLYYFRNMLRAGAVDILQADATRCGGISGFLKAGYLCEAYQIPFSSHCAPSVHLHAALSLPAFFIAEYFADHVRIEKMLFDGFIEPRKGVLKPDLSRPGIGIEFKHSDAEKYKIRMRCVGE